MSGKETSWTLLPAHKMADAARLCVAEIDKDRNEAVDRLVQDEIRRAARGLLGLFKSKIGREEALKRLKGTDSLAGLPLHFARTRYEGQRITAERLIKLAEAAGPGGEVAVTARDFAAVSDWYRV